VSDHNIRLDGPLPPAALDDPHLQPATGHPERMEALAAVAIVIGMIGFVGFIWAYWVDASTQWQAATLTVGMLGLGIGTISWGKYLMPQGPFVEERHDFHSTDDERSAFNAAITGRGGLEVKRRGLLLGLFAVGGGIMTLALLIPGVRSLGPKPAKSEDPHGSTDVSLFTTNWRQGSKLVTVGGRQVMVDDLDVGGAPTKGPEGVAAVRYVRDGYGHAIETAYLDGAGAAALSTEGKLVVRARYDDAGRPIEELFVDASGALHVSKDGCAGHRTKYDALGRKVEESCVDATGQVGVSGDGWAIRRTLHDARGNAVDESTYGADGALRADGDGVARRRNQFDERNLLQETTYFDASDRPTRDGHGVHAVKFEYGESGERIGKTELDEKGKVVATLLPSPKH